MTLFIKIIDLSHTPSNSKGKNMNKNNNKYPHYIPGMELPPGLFPPIIGYFHSDLINEICYNIHVFLLENDINNTKAQEYSIYLVSYLNFQFEKEFLEYKISAYSNKTYDLESFKVISIQRLADLAAEITNFAVSKFLNEIADEQIKNLSSEILEVAFHTIRERILLLNKNL